MKFIMCVLVLLLLRELYLLFKNKATYHNQVIILEAIARHIAECEEYEVEPLVYFYDMESYRETLYRWWDWGYTRILPPVKYEIIKPFIKEGVNDD